MTFKYILKQFALEYDNYNQFNLVQRPRKHRVTRFSLRFSSIKNPSIFNSLGQLVCWVSEGGYAWVRSAPLIGSDYTRYTILFHIRPGQEAWALVTSRDILVSIRHVTNVITWPRIYESRSRDRSGGHVTSVIPYMAQVAATDQLLIGLQSLTGL